MTSPQHLNDPTPKLQHHPPPNPTNTKNQPQSTYPIPPTFTTRKTTILTSLAQPTETYTDLSPKGSVDDAIKDLIDRLNALEGVVTTSSCAGRVSVFLEGAKRSEQAIGYVEGGADGQEGAINGVGVGRGKGVEQTAVPGGKGMGGRWLFVSHEPVDVPESEKSVVDLLGISGQGESDTNIGELDMHSTRYVRFQFEPMVRKKYIHRNEISSVHNQRPLRCQG